MIQPTTAANCLDWFRVDRATGLVVPVSIATVVRAITDMRELNSGRFETPLAIFSQRRHLTDAETR
jgi:hypothetical protein